MARERGRIALLTAGVDCRRAGFLRQLHRAKESGKKSW
jgi:hypothetical protein